jgi:hypothetical protein
MLVKPSVARVSTAARKIPVTLVAVIAFGIVAGGCGSGKSKHSQTKTVRAQNSVASALPAGTYERQVTKADIDRTAKFRNESGPNQQAPTPGPARLIISNAVFRFIALGAKPPLTIDQNVSATASGQLTIDGYTNPYVGSFCGPEIPQNASYTWAQHGSVLTLKALTDRCADRDSSLSGAWKRRG